MSSKTGFDLLEDKVLEKGNSWDIDFYLSLTDLSSPQVQNYGEILKYVLSVSEIFNNYGYEKDNMFIGGYATLTHIIKILGPQIIQKWRGSHDLDIVGKKHGIENVLQNFFDTDVFESPSLKNKKKIEIKDRKADSRVEIDLYIPEKGIVNINGEKLDQKMLSNLESIPILGINVNVPQILDLINMKLNISCKSSNLPRKKDIDDIYNLIGCFEKDNKYETLNNDPRKISEYIIEKIENENIENPKKLISIIDIQKQENSRYILSPPSHELIMNIYDVVFEKEENK